MFKFGLHSFAGSYRFIYKGGHLRSWRKDPITGCWSHQGTYKMNVFSAFLGRSRLLKAGWTSL